MSLQTQHAAMDHAPLLHWDSRALAFVAEKLGQAVQQWRAEWTAAPLVPADAGTGPQAGALVLNPHARTGPVFRLHVESAAAAGAWLVCEDLAADSRNPQAAQLVGRAVIGGGTAEPGSIAAEVCGEALAHLVLALRKALALDAGTGAAFDLESAADVLPCAAFREWSGGVRVSLPGVDGLALYLSAPAVSRLDTPRRAPAAAMNKAALTPLKAAAANAGMTLQAQLHSVELTLGQIRSLQIGDVVVVPHALDVPLQLVSPEGAVICDAYLGQVASHRALELLPQGDARA